MSRPEKFPEPDRSWWGHTRDSIAFHIATFAFKYIATKWYADMIEGTMRLGYSTAIKDEDS